MDHLKIIIQFPNGGALERIFLDAPEDEQAIAKNFRILSFGAMRLGWFDFDTMPSLEDCVVSFEGPQPD